MCETKYGKFCSILNIFRNASRFIYFLFIFFLGKVISSFTENKLLWPFISARLQGWNLGWSYRKVCTRADNVSVSENPSNQWWFYTCGFFVLFMWFWFSCMTMVLISQAALCRQPLTPETVAAGVRRAMCRWKGEVSQNSLKVQRPGCKHSYLRRIQIVL